MDKPEASSLIRVELPEDVIRSLRLSTRPTLRLDEASEWLGISRDTIEAHLAECIVKVGRTRLVVTARVHEVLAARLEQPAQQSPDPLIRARAYVRKAS